MTGAKVPEKTITSMLNATLLSPTSSGLQQSEIISISNKDLKMKMSPNASSQPVIAQSSHLMVFAAWDS